MVAERAVARLSTREVVTMGCSVEKVCPWLMLDKMQKNLVDWDLEDPKGKAGFRSQAHQKRDREKGRGTDETGRLSRLDDMGYPRGENRPLCAHAGAASDVPALDSGHG